MPAYLSPGPGQKMSVAELWASSNSAMAPRRVAGFTAPVVGADRYTLPATRHDLVLWVAAGVTSAAFDVALALSATLREVAVRG
jgi:putative iron-dependent peroxidase